jgi:ADP-ribosyl-[dinitrogen reductase] hydrolase
MSFVYYTFLAGWCAEAAGARIEFMKKRFTEEEAIDAMHMVGFNSNGILEGQITDDSEMEISLLDALIQGAEDEYFPIERIASNYIEWYHSEPFDIGQTTAIAILDAKNAEDMLTNAYEYNFKSLSNGSLMRCVPIAVFGIHKSNEIIYEMAMNESQLTHPNEIVGQITGIYCVVLASILRSRIKNEVFVLNLDFQGNPEVMEWFKQGAELPNLDTYDAIHNEGFVKHAFVMFSYFLHNIDSYSYEQAIKEVLKCGGDTDTNAKIIGNLFGAYYGNCVPQYMISKVLSFDCTQVEDPFFRRPPKYSVHSAIELIAPGRHPNWG